MRKKNKSILLILFWEFLSILQGASLSFRFFDGGPTAFIAGLLLGFQCFVYVSVFTLRNLSPVLTIEGCSVDSSMIDTNLTFTGRVAV